MRILILNPPHTAIGSRIPSEHLPPLGLLCLGGPLIDAGHAVQLLDAEFGPMSPSEIVHSVLQFSPEALLIGHSGSTSAHPTISALTRAIRAACPNIRIIYGGVFPTFHWAEIMRNEPQIDFIVRGEGEQTIVNLIAALEMGSSLEKIRGIVYRLPILSGEAAIQANPLAPIIEDLDSCRVGWELIDPRRYSYWGNKRAVVVQFSRGCPHLCNYCGQREFWRTWRHRDPVKFAAELAWLHRKYGVEVINFADENPTASRTAWKEFLEALIAQNVSLTLIGSTRASDIVRDADILPLYKKAGVARFLLGMESTDEDTLKRINKGSHTTVDREAIQLLRQNNILSLAAYVIGFKEETDRDYWRTLRQIVTADPDQIQILFATPHRWTPFFSLARNERVIQSDLRRWDYKHQVLASKTMPSWRILLWDKFIEATLQLRPKSIWRVLTHSDPALRAAMRWYYSIGRKVWPYEIWNFIFRDRRNKWGPVLQDFSFSNHLLHQPIQKADSVPHPAGKNEPPLIDIPEASKTFRPLPSNVQTY